MAQDDDTCVLAMVDAGAIPHYLRVLSTCYDECPCVQHTAVLGLWRMMHTCTDAHAQPRLVDAVTNGLTRLSVCLSVCLSQVGVLLA